VGCLIYSDPGMTAILRATFSRRSVASTGRRATRSVMDMPIHPGDPLSPDVGATKYAKRLALKDVKTFTRIPVLPISYGDAQNLLKALKGPGRAGELARFPALHVSRRTWTRESPSESAIKLGYQNSLRCCGQNSWLEISR